MIKSFAITHNIEYKMNKEFDGAVYNITYNLTKKEE